MMNARSLAFGFPLLLGAYLSVSTAVLSGSPLSMGTLPQNTSAIDWSGVALLSVNGSPNCSAIAIAPGALLTAAHCVAASGAASVSQNVTALLRSMSDVVTVTSAAVIPYPDFQASYLGGDIAIVILNETLPAWVATYGIYNLSDEMGQVFDSAGFGAAPFPTFHTYRNRFENTGIYWTSDWLSFDYDSGLAANNALSSFGASDLGIPGEGMIRFGDSGGPALINGMVAGIPSGLWRYQYLLDGQLTSADVDGVINSTIGEIGFMVRVSLYREWILATLAANSSAVISGDSTAVPEPTTLPLMAVAVAILCRVAKNRQR